MQNPNEKDKVKELLQDFICFVEKYFLYFLKNILCTFLVFGATKNNKNKKNFRFSRKRVLNFCKMIFIIYDS